MGGKAELEVPVLLITFNRPDNTRKVFEKIKQAQIKKLYVFNDGPREKNDNDNKTREKIKLMLREVDWNCDLNINFKEKNLGCGWGVAKAISWAFEHEDRLIILEDDCVPSLPFFDFCNYTLEKYKDDTRIWLISGRSHQQETRFFEEQDYIFSNYGHSWGWATWKICWKHFDMKMKKLPDFIKSGGAKNVFFTNREALFWNKRYSRFKDDENLETHVWDVQWGFSIISNGGLSIVPAKNLIENIGYSGIHSQSKNEFHQLKASKHFVIKKEPVFIVPNREYDLHHFKNHILKIHGKSSLLKRIVKKVMKIL